MRPGQDIIPDVRRVAVLKAGGLGDVLFSLPALEALRAAYPAARVTMLTSALGAEILRDRPGPVNEVIAVPPFDGRDASAETRAELDRLWEGLGAEPFDLALQMHGGGANSNPLVLRLGARVSVGLHAPDAARLDREVPYVYFQSEVMRCLEVARLAGAVPVTLEPRLASTPADADAAHALLGDDGRPLAVLHPGAGDPRRRWPAVGFAEVAAALTRHGARIAVVGTAADATSAAEIASAEEGVLDLCGRTSLPELAGVLGRAAVVVSNDSGPLHLAAAVGAATVGVYWCGNLVNAGPATVTRHRTAASWRLACPVCGTDCMVSSCPHDASFVADVPARDVIREALDLFESGARDDPREQVRGAVHHV